MRIKNFTDYTNAQLREFIDFCRPHNIANFDVLFTNSSGMFVGRAYLEGSKYHDTVCPFVIVRITKNEKAFPYFVERKKGKGYLSYLLLSRTECLIHVLAHELRHLWQSKHKRGRVFGARGRQSERETDAYAIRKVREWRRLHRTDALNISCSLKELEIADISLRNKHAE